MSDKRTYAERADYLKQAVTKRRKELKRKAVELLGGSCQICSYDRSIDALHFHHRDPSTKTFGLSQRGLTRSWTKVKEELQKCVLICANCHAEVHAGITQLPIEISE